MSNPRAKTAVAFANSNEKLVASVVSLERFQLELQRTSGRSAILSLTLNHIQSLLPIDVAGFYFPSEDGLDFVLVTPLEPIAADHLNKYVNESIESGVFGWALKHLRPAALKTVDGSNMLMFGALRTRQKVLGMFVGLVPPANHAGWDSNTTILATYLACAASTILSEELAAELHEHNRTLDSLVKKRTAQLETAKEAAEVANKAKDRFLATVSHELRTPLNAILGFSQVLRRNPNLAAKEAEQVKIIFNSAEHLLSLINDLLDLAKAEATNLVLAPSQVELSQLIREAVNIVQPRLEEKNLALTTSCAPDVSDTIIVDSKRLRQVLINLLGNAVKFTHQGSISLLIARNHECLRFCVKDTGCGISPDDIPKLCQPFQQVGNLEQQSEGSGLGLAISKKIIKALGGELVIESTPNLGSSFWFEIPCPSVTTSSPSSTPEIVCQAQPNEDLLGALDSARLDKLRQLTAKGDILALQKELQLWMAQPDNDCPAIRKLYELATNFRIKSIRSFLKM